MKVVLISDTHNQLDRVDIPEGDLLIYAGDFTNRGTYSEMLKQINILGAHVSKFKKVVAICGNHDFLGERDPAGTAQMFRENNITYLDNNETYFEGLKIYGSPWTPCFGGWAFNGRPEKLERLWSQIPNDTDILVTHGPPHEILDLVLEGERVGDPILRNRISQLNQLKLHVFGHLHLQGGTFQEGTPIYANAAICDDDYNPTRKAIVIEL